MYQRIKRYMDMSDPIVVNNLNCNDESEKSVVKIKVDNVDDEKDGIQLPFMLPEFPLIPASRGFCLTLVGVLDNFYKKLQAISQ